MEKIVSQLDAQGYFVGAVVADKSPLEPDVFLIPGCAVDAVPPDVPEGKRAKWNGAGFVLEAISQPEPEPEPADPWSPDPIKNQVRAAREIVLGRLLGLKDDARDAGDADTISKCRAARVSLLNITEDSRVGAATDDATLKAAFVAAYSDIVTAAGAGLVKAFTGFNL